MLTVDEVIATAGPKTCFQQAADVENWPRILPHYRWVRFRRRDGFARGLVEMAAWRPFGPLRYPTWWLSEMDHDPNAMIITYRHVEGVTRGMDVRWEILPEKGGRTRLRIVHAWTGPQWPLIRRFAADHVIGPHFISHIAGRTLAGIRRASEEIERGT